MSGLGGADTMFGGAGNDLINGDSGADRIYGDLGADTMTGGAGADHFIYRALTDSTLALSGRDRITDFSGTAGDRIDLRQIDANPLTAGDDAFVFVDGDFTGAAGAVVVARFTGSQLVMADVDGDGVADLAITVLSTASLQASDFLL
jgi:Ca2+-binding RTX toxin-like protein